MTVSFSAVIGTLGQRDLRTVVESLLTQTHPVHELIFVNQGSNDIEATIARYFAQVPIRVIQDPHRGLSRARNLGIQAATGDFVFFPDDDCWYPEDFCAQLEAELRKGYDLVTGRSLPHPGATNSRMARSGASRAEISIVNVLHSQIEFALAVRREVAKSVLFDPLMGLGSGTQAGADEGVDFVLRALRFGAKAIYSPQVVAYHEDPVAARRLNLHTRARKYSQGRGYVLRTYPFPKKIIARELIRPLGGTVIGKLLGFLVDMRHRPDA